MELLIPFANTGEKEDFSTTTDPTGKVSLEKGFTELYELKPEEGGLFILRKVFNQMMNLVTTDTVNWKTQTFPNWIADKGDGTPYSYPKNAVVKYTDGNSYVSKVDNNTAVPTDVNNWINFQEFGTININALPEKTTPVDTDNLAIQETGGLLKKVSWANIKSTFIVALGYLIGISTAKTTLADNDDFAIRDSQASSATKKVSWANIKSTLFNGAISLTANGYIKFPSVMGGLVIQWGSVQITTVGGTIPITFPLAFPTNCWGIYTSGTGKNGTAGRQDFSATTNVWTNNGFSIVQHNTFTAPAYQAWLAIGN